MDTAHGGRMMMELARDSGITDVTEISRRDCTHAKVKAAIETVAGRCDANDIFVFYYTGHGDTVADQDGDEDDGTDEALCLVGEDGHIGEDTYMRDDHFSQYIYDNCQAENVLVLMDCCHSGTIVDLDKPNWEGHHCISISGCKDDQESAGTGSGGLLTTSICNAVKTLYEAGHHQYSVGLLYNQMLAHAKVMKKQFGSKQKIQLHTSPHITPDTMCWPLCIKVEEINGEIEKDELADTKKDARDRVDYD